MSQETFTWSEGLVYVWSATASSSAMIAYAQNSRVAIQRGWVNRATLDGNYWDHLTGQRVDVTIGALFSPDLTIQRLFNSATALHLHLGHSSLVGSAGYLLYSGQIDSLELIGGDGQTFQFNMNYHANSWSAYGT